MLPNDPDRPDAAPAATPVTPPAGADPLPANYDFRAGPVLVAPPPGRRAPVLALALALVAILAGGALFMAGFSLGEHAASQPGTPASDDAAFGPFWNTYNTII